MTGAGTGMGLTGQQGHQGAGGRVGGASELARRSDEPPSVGRQRVTSKGGTTYAALQHGNRSSRTLVVVSDDNFRSAQTTQFAAFEFIE